MLTEGHTPPGGGAAAPGLRPTRRLAETYLSEECEGSGLGAAGWGWHSGGAPAGFPCTASPGRSRDFLSAQIPEKAPWFLKRWNRSTRDGKAFELGQVQRLPVGPGPTLSSGPARVCPAPFVMNAFRRTPGGDWPFVGLGDRVLLPSPHPWRPRPTPSAHLCPLPLAAPSHPPALSCDRHGDSWMP